MYQIFIGRNSNAHICNRPLIIESLDSDDIIKIYEKLLYCPFCLLPGEVYLAK